MSEPTGRPRGRPPGAKNKLTEQRAAAVEQMKSIIGEAIPDAFDGDAHAFLMAIYRDPSQDLKDRIDAAKSAIRYEKPALAAQTVSGPDGGPLQFTAVERYVVRPNAKEPT